MQQKHLWACLALLGVACAEPVTRDSSSEGPQQSTPATTDDMRPATTGRGVSRAIVDGRDGGGRVVYFLYPISTDSGTGSQPFDGQAAPTVTVCRTRNGECIKTVASFPWNDGRGISFCVVVERTYLEWYVARWFTAFQEEGSYRAQVWLNGKVAAMADIQVVGSSRELRALPSDVVGLRRGAILPIRFRVEKAPPRGQDESIAVGPDSAVVEVDDSKPMQRVTPTTLERGSWNRTSSPCGPPCAP